LAWKKKKLARSNLCSSELCDGLYDGGLPRTSGTVEPHNESIHVDLLDPVHDLVQDGFPGVFVTFQWIAAFQGIMKCTRHCGFFQKIYAWDLGSKL